MYNFQIVNYLASVVFATLAIALLFITAQQMEHFGIQRLAVAIAALAWASAYLAQDEGVVSEMISLGLTVVAAVLFCVAWIVLLF